jgi:ketosteroid isomerase-like protein
MRTQTNPRRKDLQKIALIAGTALMIAFSTPTAWAAAQETETGIQKAKEQYIAAFNKGDASKVAEMYTETAYLMPPGSPTVTGRAAIQKYWDAGIKAGVKNLALTPGKIDQFGEVAREIGNYSLETKDGTKLEGNGWAFGSRKTALGNSTPMSGTRISRLF